MNGRTGIFLQARLGSSRLPGKALLKIEGKNIITHAMESLNLVSADCRVLLTDEASAGSFAGTACDSGFSLFTGSAEDVLDRFLRAAEEYEVDTIIRATGDNPLVDPEAAELILKSHIGLDADYSGFDSMPLGTGVEILKTGALLKAEAESSDSYDHEHVSPYLYRNPKLFRINRIPAPEEYRLPGSSVTIDTPDDLEYVRRLYADLYTGLVLRVPGIIPWLTENKREL